MIWAWITMWYVLALPATGIMFYYGNNKRAYEPDAEESLIMIILWLFSPICIPCVVSWLFLKKIFMMGVEFPEMLYNVSIERARKKKEQSDKKKGWKQLLGF